jgi:exodeoxyribonuclease V alpha subunit
MYLGWEIARCAKGLTPSETGALASLAAACVAAVSAGSTRLPLDEPRLAAALASIGAADELPLIRSILVRAQRGDATDPVAFVVGRAGERKPLVLDGAWLYPERMRMLEERFCSRVRERLARAAAVYGRDARSLGRALAAVVSGPPTLTEEQKRAVREALGAPLALITGGPGTGKTTIVVTLLRALAWMGVSMDAVAIAAPTGKAAQRLREAIASGLAATSRDIAEAALRTMAPVPQTLHRLLGWSPASSRFARHENDPLPHRVVVVDEASMVDLAMMDRLVRALHEDARLVLLGDANQLPSVDAGAVFRDLCAGLGAVRLSTNLRVGRDPGAQRIIVAADAINAGQLDGRFRDAVVTRQSVKELAFEGVEHLVAPWADVGDELLDRWWRERIASFDDFARCATRTYRIRGASFDDGDRLELRQLFNHYARARLLCATRVGTVTGAESINAGLLSKFAGSWSAWRRHGPPRPVIGAPVMVERNDYERNLFNGDQGLVVLADGGDSAGPQPMAVFPQGDGFQAVPLDALAHLAPCFAMTVHKAQGTEFDQVALVLPDADLPLLTRELVYTAVTRARRSVLLVGSEDLLARAVSRTMQRHSGVTERLAMSRR